MNSKALTRAIFLVVLFGFIAYANYPSFYKFFFLDPKKAAILDQGKLEEARALILPLQGIELFLPEVEKNRIRVLIDEAATFPLENPALQKILGGGFTYKSTNEANYLDWAKPKPDLFLSDFARDLNGLVTNAKKIAKIGLSADAGQILFYMQPGKRLSIDSPPINALFQKSAYDWQYDSDKELYRVSLADPANLLNLGLDLKGGVYLDVGVDPDKMLADFFNQRRASLDKYFTDKSLLVQDSTKDGHKLVYHFNTPPKINFSDDKLRGVLEGFDHSETANQIVFSLQDSYLSKVEQDSISQAIGIIRNRIDQLGVKEPIIQKRGSASIVVQIPGQNESLRIKELITKPANLEFHMVQDAQSTKPSESLDMETIDPLTKEVLKVDQVKVDKEVALKGDLLTDARVVFDPFTGAPQISMTLNAEGARQFGRLTEANVGKQMAIVLDNKIKSAPRINQAIFGGQASITGQFSVEEARDLSIVLRSGSLPVSLVINEERVIGASLGEDSIKKSIYSLLIGFLVLTVFITFYYRLSGVFAVLSLLVNFFLILSILAFFGATLTLPGIAGVILTIAMAVDSNVLVFERIREELHIGSTPRKAIQQGFNRVAVTIMDANLATLLIAIVLFQFGTGPIKGFAVTLSIGIVTTLFTSLVFTRFLFELKYMYKAHIQRISI